VRPAGRGVPLRHDLGAQRFAGQLNVSDASTRLMFTLLKTGAAPHTFYETDAQGDRPRAHFTPDCPPTSSLNRPPHSPSRPPKASARST